MMRTGRNLMVALAVALAGGCLTMALTATTLHAAPARAQTSLFAIAKMTCPTCPITVKAAMSRVPGVSAVKVDFDSKTAMVTYDPALATPAGIAAASNDVGFPAQVIGR